MNGIDLGILKIKPCKWGRCNGSYAPGNPCSRCGIKWPATMTAKHAGQFKRKSGGHQRPELFSEDLW